MTLSSHLVGFGDDCTDAMAKGILTSSVFIACIGPTFWERPNCMSELKFARKKQKKLLFVILPSHPSGEIDPSIDIMMDNSLYLDLRDLDAYDTAHQDDFARRVAEHAAEARQN